MKKNITINLCGSLFAIDEDACQLLDQYTENMRLYFSKQVGGDEIIDDIEHRIAELFWEHKEQGHEAIDLNTVRAIIEKIGNPEQMDGDSDNIPAASTEETGKEEQGKKSEQSHKGTYHKEEESRRPRKLYRNGNNKQLAGVLSGLCQYFGGTDATPWRIGFIVIALLFLCGIQAHYTVTYTDWNGSVLSHTVNSLFSPFNFVIGIIRWLPVIVYVILWAVVPESITVEDRLKAQGKKVDSDNIKHEVLKEHEQQQTAASTPNTNKGCADGCITAFVTMIKVAGFGCLGCLGVLIVILIIAGCLAGFSIKAVKDMKLNFHPYIQIGGIERCQCPDLEQEYYLSPFEEIEVNGIGTLNIIQGNEYKLVASGDSTLVARTIANSDLHTLKIENATDQDNNTLHGAINYTLTAPQISHITINGPVNLEISDSVSQNTPFTLEYNGVGSADIAHIQCPQINIENKGVGSIVADIDTDELNLKCTGVGSVTVSGKTKSYNEQEVSEFVSTVDTGNLVISK